MTVEQSIFDPTLRRSDPVGSANLADDSGGPPVLELVGVTKSYSSEPPVVALDGVSFAVKRGELVAVVGPSGSGKSTLLHLMGTLDRPSSGSVRVTGLDVSSLSDKELAALRATRIGFVFQQFFLAEHASSLENVADGLLYAGMAQRLRRRQGDRGAHPGGAGSPLQCSSHPAVGGRAPARGDRPGAGR